MRLLFAHDHRFLRGPAGELYTPGHLPASTWQRFLENFEEVHVIARDGGPIPDGVRLGRADSPGVQFEFVPSLSSARQLILRSPELDNRMSLAVSQSDAVVARLPSEIGLLALRHAKLQAKPYAIEVVGCIWDSCLHHGAFTARLYAPLAYIRTRRAIADAPLALYVTSSWLQNRYPTKGHSSSASNVTIERMDPAEGTRREARLMELERGRPPVLGTIASLGVKYKGIQTALAALSRLRSLGLDLTYRILGPGPAEHWKELAGELGVGDLVHFDGTRTAGKEVFAWLDTIDLYLQPSFTEALPRAMIEAMSRGAACVGSMRGGIPELLPQERLHSPGDVGKLVEIIRELAMNPAALAAASRADRQAARQFEPETLNTRRREFYSRLRAQTEKHDHDD
jgi:glycosyltransferase involved in cell wall biosynthesis